MTDSKDSAVAEGTQGEANPKGSDKANGQPSSGQPEYVTVEQFNKVAAQIEKLARGTQSEKDRAVKRVEEKVSALDADLRTVLQNAHSRGQNISDVLSEIEEEEERETRRLMREFLASQRQGASDGLRGNDSQGVDVTGIIAELELDPNDVRVQVFRSKQFGSDVEAYKEASKLLKSMTKQPSDADKSSRVAEEKGSLDKQEALEQEYKEGSKGLRGQELINFQRTMRRKGLKI